MSTPGESSSGRAQFVPSELAGHSENIPERLYQIGVEVHVERVAGPPFAGMHPSMEPGSEGFHHEGPRAEQDSQLGGHSTGIGVWTASLMPNSRRAA